MFADSHVFVTVGLYCKFNIIDRKINRFLPFVHFLFMAQVLSVIFPSVIFTLK